jgi:glucosyl-3-phosphoglycerate synthase
MLTNVLDWFEQSTFRGDQWHATDLAAVKGLTRVAVILPALNEQATVGTIVDRIRRDLVDNTLLVDELVVVDSGSTDRTVDVAADAGARIVCRDDVLSMFPPLPGKGEAMWRGLAATTSEVVAFVDADLKDFTSSFVTGILGPLLTNPDIHLVKATYDRPLDNGDTVLPAGGGRVTELVARPLLNIFWPQLAGFVQPLAGEYAARRTLLESLPFPTGYGVEVAMLVDALRMVGLSGMAQVDLVRRQHRNAAIDKLGRMSMEIIHVIVDRLEHEGRLALTDEIGAMLTQFTRSADGYQISNHDMRPVERPALASLADYTSVRSTGGVDVVSQPGRHLF